jgi:DNA-binding NtrC family response regulator
VLACVWLQEEHKSMSAILICEDDAFLAADLMMSVESAGHQVHGVYSNARDALRDAGKLKPDIAIIDLELADGHTGSSLARTLESLGVKVIVISGHPNTGPALGTVAHTYAEKPVSQQLVAHLLGAPAQCRVEPTLISKVAAGAKRASTVG